VNGKRASFADIRFLMVLHFRITTAFFAEAKHVVPIVHSTNRGELAFDLVTYFSVTECGV